MKKLTKCFAMSFLVTFSVTASAVDSCKGYTSTGNPFACGTYGNCTWWAAYKRPDVQGKIGGDARAWYQSAVNNGFDVGSDPKLDSIAVFSNGSNGHVAYVESKNSDGSFYVSEMDYYGSLGTHNGVQHATYHPYSGNRYTREDVVTGMETAGNWTLTGFIYRKSSGANSTCTHLNGIYTICWVPTSSDISCKGGTDWVIYDSEQGDMLRIPNSDYCPDYSADTGGGSEVAGPMPVTGGTNTGTLANLIANNSDVENASKTKVTTLHINEPGFCRMQTKNIGTASATAFQSKCWLSDGDKVDKYPKDLGKQDTKGLAKGATNTEHEDFTAPEFPGKYNLVWCTESAKQVKESNEGDNCHKEDPFTVWSNANVLTTNITIIGNKSVLLPGETFSIDTTITNNGENFGKTMLIGYYNDGALIGTDRILRENLKGGVSKVENLDIAIAPMTPGMHTLMVCPDFDNRNPETNETDNCKSMPYEVRLPSVYNPTNAPLITSCAQAPDPDFNIIPAIPAGDVGTVIFGNNKQRLFLPVATLVQAKTSFVWGSFAAFDPSLVTRICFNSADTNWGVTASTACANTFTLQGTNWVVDIPNTPQASKGTWSFKQGDTEYWVNPSTITNLNLDTDGHIRYNGWTPNTVTVSEDASGMTLYTAFSSQKTSGFWIPSNTVLNGKVFWNNDQDNYPGMPGQLSCDANGKLIASIPNVAPASTGRILLGLTDATQFGWQTTNQWILPAGAFITNADGDYKLPLSASPFQKREVTYNSGQQKLTLTINGDSRMLTSFNGITNISQVTKDAYFDAWIVPTGQATKLIQGTVTRSSTGIWTIVFTGLPPEFGGNAYLTLTNGTKGWQSVATFAFGSGILVDVTAGDYVMPK